MTNGIYALFVHVPYSLALSVGGLGVVNLKAGYYAYIGSALGGFGQRIERHMREEKKLHWHIDHLLARARAVDVVVAHSGGQKECAVAKELSKNLPSIRGFGSSDCRCESHLFYSPNFHELLERVLVGFKIHGLKPEKGIGHG